MTALLAGVEYFEAFRKTFTTGPSSSDLLVFAAGALVVVLLIALAARRFNHEAPPKREPPSDYLTLAVDVLGLSEQDRRDLQRIAGRAGLQYPASMLLSPANLARAVERSGDGAVDHGLRRRTEDLSQRLFGVGLPAAAEPKPQEQRRG